MIALIVLVLFINTTGFAVYRLIRAGDPGRPPMIRRMGAVTELVAGAVVLVLTRALAESALVQWVWVGYLVVYALAVGLVVARWKVLPSGRPRRGPSLSQ